MIIKDRQKLKVADDSPEITDNGRPVVASLPWNKRGRRGGSSRD